MKSEKLLQNGNQVKLLLTFNTAVAKQLGKVEIKTGANNYQN